MPFNIKIVSNNSIATTLLNLAAYSNTAAMSAADGVTYANAIAYAANAASTAYANAVAVGGSGAAAYANAVANAAALYQTTVGLSAKVLVLTSNNSLNLGGLSLATIQSQITSNAAAAYANAISAGSGATAYANAVANAAALYQTTVGLSANVAVLTANNSTNFGGLSLATIQGQITGNAATAYTNATNFATTAAATAFANAIANAASNAASIYQTSAGLSANVSSLLPIYTGVVNSSSNTVGTTFVANTTTMQVGTAANNVSVNTTSVLIGNSTVFSTVNSTLFSGTANNSTNFGGLSLVTMQGQITGNAATAYTNATNFATTAATAAYANAIANAASNAAGIYQTSAGLSANVAVLTANNSTNFGSLSLATVQSQITGNAATAYTNATNFATTAAATAFANAIANAASNAASIYQTSAGLSANVSGLLLIYTGIVNGSSHTVGTTFVANATTMQVGTVANNVSINTTSILIGNSIIFSTINSTLFSGTANNSTNFGGLSLATVQGQITGNATTSYTNATTFATTAATAAYANAVANSAAIYQTSAGLSANVSGLLPLYTGIVNGSSHTVGTTFVANATTIQIGVAANNVSANTTTILIGNSTVFSTINSTLFSGTSANATNFNGQLAAYYTNATNITTGVLPWSQAPINTVNTSGTFTITGMHTYSNGITFSNTVTANGSNGVSGQLLTSSGPTGNVAWSSQNTGLEFVINGGGVTITTGIKGYVEIPFGCTVSQWTILLSSNTGASVTDAITIDVLADTYTNYVSATSMVGAGTKPNVSAATKNQAVPASWTTTTIAAGSIVGFNITSAPATAQQCTISLKLLRT
jgi:hypothetical protein